ncbi:MAG: hypothetical protein ACK55I_14310, partial [bacterium]
VRRLPFEFLQVIGDLQRQLLGIRISYRYCALTTAIGYLAKVDGSPVRHTNDQRHGPLQIGRPTLFIDPPRSSGSLGKRAVTANRQQ